MNSTVSTEVRDYVVAVRAALSDLPAEDVEEFTTGMEADLAERLAEPGEGTLRDRLGDPEAYAAELRAAAGLPPRVVGPAAKKPAGQRLSEWWDRTSGQVLTAMPWLRELRPIWWAVRGFSLAFVPALVLGAGIVWLGILGAILSIAFGLMAREGKFSGEWVGPIRVIGNLAAIALLPFALILLATSSSYHEPTYGEPQNSMFANGIASAGNPLTNIYAYGEDGRRIDKVRLYDESGRELRLDLQMYQAALDQTEYEQLVDPLTGDPRTPDNVFPIRWDGGGGWERLFDSTWEPPLAISPLPGPVPSVEPSADPSASAGVSESPSPSASPSLSSSPSASPSASSSAPRTSPGSGAAATPSPTATSR